MLIGMKNSMASPAALFKVDLKGAETPLENINSSLYQNIKWGNVVKRMVTTTDNKQMLTWVIYPPDFASSNHYRFWQKTSPP